MKRKIFNNLLCVLNFPFLIPQILAFYFFVDKRFYVDFDRYAELYGVFYRNKMWRFIYLFLHYKTLRNVFYYRMGWKSVFVHYYPEVASLHIKAKTIGGAFLLNTETVVGYHAKR